MKSKTPEYRAWQSMKQRCINPNSGSWINYGARGIKVYKEWQENFQSFFTFVGPRPSPRHSLDRYPDNNGDYKPGNVRWATPSQQARNTRQVCWITHKGETKCISDWARAFGIALASLQYQYKRYGDLSHIGIQQRIRRDSWIGEQREITHCPHGHPYDKANTRYYDGKRYCRICGRQRCRTLYYRKKREIETVSQGAA